MRMIGWIRFLGAFIIFGVICGSMAIGSPQDNLAKTFANPPASARPHTWWHWCNGNSSKEGITADLEAMKRAGIGGAQIFNVDVGIPAGTTPFMSDRWREQIVHAAREANRLGIELCIHNCAGWSSSGGPWITPEHAMQILTFNERAVHGPLRFSEKLAPPTSRLGFYRQIAVLAFKRPPMETDARKLRIRQIIAKAAFVRGDRILPDTSPSPAGLAIPREGVFDITNKTTAGGQLDWDVPEGDWIILQIGHTPTGKDNHPAPPEGRGLECDKMSREAMDAHWAGMMTTVLRDIGPLAGKVVNNSLIDSYEVGSQNWTPKFREEFRKRRGYDVLPFLPVITGRVVESVEISERFLWDFRRTICDLFAENYFNYFGSLCRKRGMKFSVEGYGNGSFDDIQVGGLADIPMGEFWVGGAAMETTKLASSSAHTHGHKVVGAESFTADNRRGRWLVDPYSIKALGDLVFCNGINRYIFHRYANQPWLDLKPGMTMGPWGMHFERTVTWWNQGAAWLKYVARCQHLLQSGRFVGDVCYFYGEEGPNTLPARRGLRPAVPDGYDYDGCDADTVLNRMSVRDGRIVLPDGMSYRVLVLPESTFMTPAVTRKIRDLVREGAIVVGPRPVQSPSLAAYPACDNEVRQIAQDVWADCDGNTVLSHGFGKGRVYWGVKLGDILGKMGAPPDFEPGGSFSGKAYIHRVIGDADFYFVSNQKYRPEVVDCMFRVSGRVPELWSPDTGRMETAPVWEEKDGRTRVHLQFEPAGSVFVVFRSPSAGAKHFVNISPAAAQPSQVSAPRITINRAYYEPADGGTGADVTAKVRELVASGELTVPATNEVFGDPTPNVVKRLRVEYTVDGQARQQTVGENETMELAQMTEGPSGLGFELATRTSGGVELTPWEVGDFTFKTADGRDRSVKITAKPEVIEADGSWSVTFPPGLGAPGRVNFAKLISWPENTDQGVKYFSGTAEYTKEIVVPFGMLGPGRAVVLDLGQVKNFAEVKLNGRDLGVLWKAPFRLDVSGLLKPGKNSLSIRVTNLWPNRLIGDEQLPDDVEWRGEQLAKWPDWLLEGKPRPQTGRVAFTTWRFYRKDSPLLESGLLGPVVVRSVKKVTITP